MAITYYDDAIVYKLKKWIPDASKLRVLDPEQTEQLFTTKADDSGDSPIKLPMITLSRGKDLELLSVVKQEKSFNGLKIVSQPSLGSGQKGPNAINPGVTPVVNVIPIKPQYQLDIWTKTKFEAHEYVRNFVFKLINNPLLIIQVPYNNFDVRHTANIRLLNTVSDTSDIAARLFPGQFHRWTIQFEIHDAFLFSVPYRKNWTFLTPDIELSEQIQDPGDVEVVTQLEDFRALAEDNPISGTDLEKPDRTENENPISK